MGNIFSDEVDETQDYEQKKQQQDTKAIEGDERETPKKPGKQNSKQTNVRTSNSNSNNANNNNTTIKRRKPATKPLVRNKSKSSNRRYL
jgi:hypothetical protein